MENNKSQNTFFTKMSKVRKLTYSGIVIALYVAVMFLTQGFAFGQYQIRIATGLYALAAIHPFLIIPLGIANLLSNTLMGGLGPLDMFGGLVAGILTSLGCYYLKKINIILVAVPIIFIPSLLVPVWLSYILHLPYSVLVVSIGIGQIIPGILGVFIAKDFGKLMNKI